jgi:hypothetical protein
VFRRMEIGERPVCARFPHVPGFLTRFPHIGNEPMESAKNSGQLEGGNEILDTVAPVVAGLTQAK